MIGLILAAGFTVVSASNSSVPATSWTCAYASSRLPRTLGLLGSDTASAEETRAARKRLNLSETVLTRASRLAIARSLRANRLIVLRCSEEGANITLEAQPFDVERPLVEPAVRVSRPAGELIAAIDDVARRVSSPAGSSASLAGFKGPNAKALAKAGAALLREPIGERAAGLSQALEDDPTSVDIRLATVEALIAARDFEGAVRVANAAGTQDAAHSLLRALRFLAASAQLEAGRYSEAAEKFEALRKDLETAAVLNNLGVARFRMRQTTAAALFESAAFLPDHRQRDITFNRCLTLIFDGKAEQALPSIDMTLKADPQDVRTRLLRVWALRTLNREPERGDEWVRLMAMAPSFSLLLNPDLARKLERIFLSERNPSS